MTIGEVRRLVHMALKAQCLRKDQDGYYYLNLLNGGQLTKFADRDVHEGWFKHLFPDARIIRAYDEKTKVWSYLVTLPET